MGLLDKIFGTGNSEETSSSSSRKDKGTSESTAQINPMLQGYSGGLLDRTVEAATLPYMPNRGVRVAGIQPGHEAAFDGLNAMSNSLGRAPTDYTAGLPEMETIGGVTGYTTGDIFDAISKKSDPDGQYAALMQSPIIAELLSAAAGGGEQSTGGMEDAVTSGGNNGGGGGGGGDLNKGMYVMLLNQGMNAQTAYDIATNGKGKINLPSNYSSDRGGNSGEGGGTYGGNYGGLGSIGAGGPFQGSGSIGGFDLGNVDWGGVAGAVMNPGGAIVGGLQDMASGGGFFDSVYDSDEGTA